MPKSIHHTFKEGGIALWRIEETADELYALLHTRRYDEALATIHHDARRAEWLAVRVLLAQVLGNDKHIDYRETGSPYLTDGSYHISISHTKGYAVLAYHRNGPIGVDVEHVAERVMRVAHRYTRPEEYDYINRAVECERLMYYILNWSAKETLYKYVGDARAADFQDCFLLQPYMLQPSQGEIVGHIFLDGVRRVRVYYFIFSDIVCTYCSG